MVFRIVTVVLAAIVAVGLAILTWPQFVDLQDTYGIAQIISFRVLMIFAAGIPVLFLLILLIFRRTRFFAVTFLTVFVAFAVANSLILNARGWGTSTSTTQSQSDPATTATGAATGLPADPSAEASTDPSTDAPALVDPGTKPAGSVTVLNWNVRGGSVSAQAIADLAISSGAQVITLPEGFGDTSKEVAALMLEAGTPMWTSTNTIPAAVGANSTSLLIAESLGQYEVSTTLGNNSPYPSVVAVPVDGEGPTIAAVHPVSPGDESQMSEWRNDLTWITGLCTQPNIIIGGDFNATLDHLTDLARCQDAARSDGAAAVGTWPIRFPALMGAPIDHIMSTTSWSAESFTVVKTEDDSGSDHRPIVAVLVPVG